MTYWHMQLHPGEFDEWDVEDIKQLLKKNLIGCAGDPVQTFNEIEIGDCVLIRHGGAVLALVKVEENPRPILPEEKVEGIWYDQCAKIKILRHYDGLSVSGTGWFLPKTLMPVENENAFKYINKLYMDYTSEIRMADLIGLLVYKKQIILQGSPGTGKTRLAELLGSQMTKPSIQKNPITEIDDFFKNAAISPEKQAERDKMAHLQGDFINAFPADQLQNLTLERYCIGTGSNDSFCWWIERGLRPLSSYSPGSAKSYLIYFDKAKDNYSTHFKHSTELMAAAEISEVAAMELLAKKIADFIQKDDYSQLYGTYGSSLLLKMLNSYYPDKYFPINSIKCMDNVLKILGIDYTGMATIQKNLTIQKEFEARRKIFMTDVTSHEFMRFLFENFDLKGEIQMEQSTVINPGDYKIVQFHPSYTYEDFVRGITANADGEKMNYRVEERILGEFAQRALDNPTANYVLIIDEINRANLPAVLGELIYALEYRFDPDNPKKTTVESLYGIRKEDTTEPNRELRLPKNFFIIGTMNTADRSVGHIDYAIRRRFAFVDVVPEIEPVHIDVKVLFKTVSELFIENLDTYDINKPMVPSKNLAPDFRPEDVWIGHSYFICKDKEEKDLPSQDAKPILLYKIKYEVIPILKEYIKDGILLDNDKTKDVIQTLSAWS